MREQLLHAVELTRNDLNALEVFEKTTKLGEEFGELCEATLLHFGRIRHKPTIGTPIEEGVDMILCIIDVLSICYPELTGDQLMDQISLMLTEKKTKWHGYMEIPE